MSDLTSCRLRRRGRLTPPARFLSAFILLGLSAVGAASGAAQELIEREFAVTVLPSTFGFSDRYVPRYPATVRLRVPTEHALLLDAYGVADRILVAPRGWFGGGDEGMDGSAEATLGPRSGSPVPTGFVKLDEYPYCVGCAAGAAAKYFSRVREHYAEITLAPPSTTPPLRPLLRRVYLTPHLIAYQAPSTPGGLEINGVAYTPLPDKTKGNLFMNLEVGLPEVGLPPSNHALASTILNAYIAKLK